MKMPKTCKIKPSDIFRMTDALFGPAEDDGEGWVFMMANAYGRACVNALFPKAHITWRDGIEGLPEDWRGFSINVADTIAATEHKLPLEITGGADLREATPQALAFLFVAGVNREGASAAFQDADGEFRIFRPNSARN